MKTALLYSPRNVGIGEVPEPRPRAREVLIRLVKGGICGSDVHFYLGHRTAAFYPHVLGHELLGRIVELGEGATNLAIGQRVIVEPNYPCGSCALCRSGRGRICPNKRSPGISEPGLFSEIIAVPEDFVWPVGEDISDEDAVTIEPLCVSLSALFQSRARLGDTVVVLGCGATGLLLVQAAVAQGLRVLAYSRGSSKLELAREMGAETPEDADAAKLWAKEGVCTVFECAGAAETVELALAAAPRGSEVSLIGLSVDPAKLIPLRFVREGISLVGSMIYDHPADFARAISLVSRGVLRPSRIVTNTFPFSEMPRAIEAASSGGAVKVVIQ